MKKREVNIILKGDAKLPIYATERSAGADLYSIDDDFVLEPMQRALVHTGVYIELPIDAEAQVRSRSGLSLKNGIVAVLGTVDADYQGEVGAIIINLSNESFVIKKGERIAQMVMNGDGGLFQAVWKQVDEFERSSERGAGGFGHTGNK